MSTELVLPQEALAPFKRNGLMCYRRVLPDNFDGMPHFAWVAGDERGVIAFTAAPLPDHVPRMIYGAVLIQGQQWMGTDVGRHTPEPMADWDAEYGPRGACMFLDGMSCYYDGTSLGAMKVLQKVVEAKSEEVIWDELKEYFDAWIGSGREIE